MNEAVIPFEIHITTANLTPERLGDFISYCIKKEAKPLLIELSKGDVIHQPMMSMITRAGSLQNVLQLAGDISAELNQQNFPVQRIKIEVPPATAGLFESTDGVTKKYFECHIKIMLKNVDTLLSLCEKHKAHLSINALKNQPDRRFITLREFGERHVFEKRMQHLAEALRNGGWEIVKEEAEYCIYDSNNLLDKGWLPQ